ncbi:hypothetical protein ABT275_43230, partial [Streptomyces sp. NPDC001185]|uniref:hypothetical protein n=1 Tax=Streptomyces sp. NPDC001185 TaxID=3154380 RepID=UPI00331F8CF5
KWLRFGAAQVGSKSGRALSAEAEVEVCAAFEADAGACRPSSAIAVAPRTARPVDIVRLRGDLVRVVVPVVRNV